VDCERRRNRSDGGLDGIGNRIGFNEVAGVGCKDNQSRRRVEAPDLSGVKAIGCTDLMPGEASAVCSRLDWIEGLWGKDERQKIEVRIQKSDKK